MDLLNYLKRIKYSGEVTPSIEVLNQLQQSHLLHVPFENLDIHYGKPISLDIDPLYQKVVENHRGGFCYELNGLFFELLISLGFKAKRISARVFDQEKGYGPEFDHLAILVDIQGNLYLTDVGFGEFSMKPLLLELNLVQQDVTGEYLIDRYDDSCYRVNRSIKGLWVPQYLFTGQEREIWEFSAMCRYHQTSPESHFTQKRICSMPIENGRVTITGNVLKIRDKEAVQETVLASESEFREALRRFFGFRMV